MTSPIFGVTSITTIWKAKKGVFAECKKKEETLKYEIVATDIPDVYKVADVGYLRVRTMALSKTLRAMGRVFALECVQNDDGTWTPSNRFSYKYKWLVNSQRKSRRQVVATAATPSPRREVGTALAALSSRV